MASDVARRTLTRTLHRVAEGAVVTLALLAAVRPPVLVVTGCSGTEKKQNILNPEENTFKTRTVYKYGRSQHEITGFGLESCYANGVILSVRDKKVCFFVFFTKRTIL